MQALRELFGLDTEQLVRLRRPAQRRRRDGGDAAGRPTSHADPAGRRKRRTGALKTAAHRHARQRAGAGAGRAASPTRSRGRMGRSRASRSFPSPPAGTGRADRRQVSLREGDRARRCCADESTWRCTAQRTCRASCPPGSRSSAVPAGGGPARRAGRLRQSIDELPAGAHGRHVQPSAPLAAARAPSRTCDVVPLRGNVDTRLRQARRGRVRRDRAGAGRPAPAGPRPTRPERSLDRDAVRPGARPGPAGARRPRGRRADAARGARSSDPRGPALRARGRARAGERARRELPHAGRRARARGRRRHRACTRYVGLPDGSEWITDRLNAARDDPDAAGHRARPPDAGRRRRRPASACRPACR